MDKRRVQIPSSFLAVLIELSCSGGFNLTVTADSSADSRIPGPHRARRWLSGRAGTHWNHQWLQFKSKFINLNLRVNSSPSRLESCSDTCLKIKKMIRWSFSLYRFVPVRAPLSLRLRWPQVGGPARLWPWLFGTMIVPRRPSPSRPQGSSRFKLLAASSCQRPESDPGSLAGLNFNLSVPPLCARYRQAPLTQTCQWRCQVASLARLCLAPTA